MTHVVPVIKYGSDIFILKSKPPSITPPEEVKLTREEKVDVTMPLLSFGA